MAEVVGCIAELWRYPVKALLGEQAAQLSCDRRGVQGDRRFAFQGMDGRLGSNKTTRRFRRMPGLLSMGAFLDGEGACWVRFEDGAVLPLSDPSAARLVSDVVNEEVAPVEESATSHFDDAPLHLLSRASLAWLAARRPDDEADPRRFRPNVLLDTDPPGDDRRVEDAWVGHEVGLGEVVVTIEQRTKRCVVPTLAQGGLGSAPGILRTLHDQARDQLGVYARVRREGVLRVGDPVRLLA